MSNAGRGAAYPFWVAVNEAQLAQELSDTELQKRSGVARSTVDRLKTGARPPQAKTVHRLADALQLDRDDSLKKAGLKPEALPGEVDTRAAIKADPAFTIEQRETLLRLVDTFEQVNQVGPNTL